MSNRTKLTDERIEKFLSLLHKNPNVTRAAEEINVSRQRLYERRDEDPAFKKRWEAAVKIGVTCIEDEMLRRAVEGVEEPVFYQGKEVATVTKYSDTLLIVLAKAHWPEKYKERHDITSDDKPLLIIDK